MASISMYKAFFFIFLCIICCSMCTTKKKKNNRLEKFQSEQWTQDRNGCSGIRMELKGQLLSLKHNMRGFKVDEIVSLLGKPDAQELYSRSQRFYIYFIEPGPKCGTPKDNPQALFIRFSALGIANEFIVKPLND